MSANPEFSHNGIRDDFTHSTAPPLFYLHSDRMIAGCTRNNLPFSLVAFTLSSDATPDQILELSHSITLSMRREDLCGRLGRYQFNVALSGDANAAGELSRRVLDSFSSECRSHFVQWKTGESTLDLFLRLDQLSEI